MANSGRTSRSGERRVSRTIRRMVPVARRRRIRTCGKRASAAVGVRSITHGSLPQGWGRPACQTALVERPPVLVVFGARNVGRAVVADRIAAGWRAGAVARTDATLAALRE